MTGPAVLTHQVTGAGAPILLLNGGLMTIAAWEPIAAPLSQTRTVIRCDLRGQMLSPGVPPASIDGHVDELLRLLDALGLSRVDVAGASFGALVGLRLAATHPSRVRSLVAANATAWIAPEAWALAAPVVEVCRAAAAGQGGGEVVVGGILATTFSDAYLEANAAVFAQRKQFVAMLPPAYFQGLLGMFEILATLDLRPCLGAIRCPTLVLAAEHDRTFPAPASRDLAGRITGAEFQELGGASHGVVVEEPMRVHDAIERFLARTGA